MTYRLLSLPRSRAVRGAIAAVCAVPVVLSILACPGPGPGPQDAGGPDLFKLAVNGAPGGALLSAFALPAASGSGSAAYLAGGYVSVDHAMITDGKVGRLVFYDGSGRFSTVCTTDEVLWWVTGYHDPAAGDDHSPPTWVIYAVGEGGRVLRYRGGTCETLPVDVTYPAGLPTFWGAVAPGPNDLWLVGGSALPNGPKGVLVHYDGTHFTQEPNLPTSATSVNLYKIDLTHDTSTGTATLAYGYVVGEGGTVLRHDFTGAAGGAGWAAMTVTGARSQDNRLFTVTCSPFATDGCVAVGGAGSGLLLSNQQGTGWANVPSIGSQTISDLPGINGVWTDGTNIFYVGVQGLTMHSTGTSSFARSYVPPQALTSATLHGVNGYNGVVFAVGGEIGVTDATQKAVILLRNDAANTFTFDGTTYMAQGDLRSCLGNCSGGQ